MQILEQRQRKELAALESDFQNEKQIKVDQALSDLKARYENEKDSLLSRHNIELQELVSSCVESDLEKKKAELLRNQQAEILNLEQMFSKECSHVEASITAELEAKHANAKITTRERHYQVSLMYNYYYKRNLVLIIT
jgi:hypothetical protein